MPDREQKGHAVKGGDNAVEQQRKNETPPHSCQLLGHFEGGRKRPQDLLNGFANHVHRGIIPQVAAIVRLEASCLAETVRLLWPLIRLQMYANLRRTYFTIH